MDGNDITEVVKEEKKSEDPSTEHNNQENLRSVRKNSKNGLAIDRDLSEDAFEELFGNDDSDDFFNKDTESEGSDVDENSENEALKSEPSSDVREPKARNRTKKEAEEESEPEKAVEESRKRKRRKKQKIASDNTDTIDGRKKKGLKEDNLNGARSVKHCDVCSLPFRYVTSLLAHKKIEHPEMPKFQCPECKQVVGTWVQYNKHLKKHKEPEPELDAKTIKCDVCLKEYEYINSLIQHRRVNHPGNKSFKCTLCNAQFNLYKDYKLHLRLSHKDSGIKLSLSGLICDICGKEFLCHYNLSNHRKHHGSPQFKCDVCNKLYKTKKSLHCHQRIHTGEKPYTCETCGKSFPGKSYLINHNITHSGQKPFVCEICGKAFSKKWNMIQHERIHTGERPYKCPVCSQGFIQNFILKDHMKKAHNRKLEEFAKPAEFADS